MKLTSWKDPDRNVTQVLFGKDLAAWFEAHLDEGDEFYLESVGEPPVRTLRLQVPDTREEVVPIDNYESIEVRPDWTDGRALLGHQNPIRRDEYVAPPFLRLMLRAAEEERLARAEQRPAAPFFAILDEMNLAHVEHYFADVLSCLESDEPMKLHDSAALERGEAEEGEALAVPRQLPVPTNLFITGTVNVDETTHAFSPKVLDRAFVLEFNQVDLEGFGALAPIAAAGAGLRLTAVPPTLVAERRPNKADWNALQAEQGGAIADALVALHRLLAEEHRHFGYRVATEIARFVRLAVEQCGGGDATRWSALDAAILAKVLPKLTGTEAELDRVTAQLLAFAVAGVPPSSEAEAQALAAACMPGAGGAVTAGDHAVRFPRTAAKLMRLRLRLRRTGYAAFIE